MRVDLKGVNRVSKTLKNGRKKTYYYAWKGGPRLDGKPGSPEFVDAYRAAHNRRKRVLNDTLQHVFDKYLDSLDFKDLKERTRKDYRRQILRIEERFADFPVAALAEKDARGLFLDWRDELAARSRRQADYAFAVLALITSWAEERNLVPCNPFERPKKRYRSQRVDTIWSENQQAAFLRTSPSHLMLAFMMALWTGQRQGDLIALPWSAYDGKTIKLKQSRTGAKVVIPVGTPLRAVLDKTPRTAVTILATTNDTSWTSSGFRASWRKACIAADIEGVTFHDLRGTAVTRLAVAGCTVPEIASITGHTLRRVQEILDEHYLSRTNELAEAAILKLEQYGK